MAGEHPSVFVKRVCRAQRIPASAFTNELFPDRKWLASFLEGFDDLAAPKYIYSLAYVLKTPPAVIRRWQENYRRGSTVPRKPKPHLTWQAACASEPSIYFYDLSCYSIWMKCAAPFE